MKLKASDIIEFINTFAPEESQEEWDNSGLQIGDRDKEINRILLLMDITDKSIDYAINNKFDMLISHHPFFFEGIKNIDFASYKGRIIKNVVDHNMILYSAHTSLDKSTRGINTALANKLQLRNLEYFTIDDELSIGVYGSLDDMKLEKIIDRIAENIVPREFIRIYGKQDIRINRIGLVGGSGASMLNEAKKHGVNLLITGDIKHHDGQYAYEKDMILIDISHYYSEYPGLELLKNELIGKFDIEVEIYKDPVFLINI